jgi:hypothetical protein
MRTKSDKKKIEEQLKALKQRYRVELMIAIKKVFEQLKNKDIDDEGLTLDEITKKVLNKPYAKPRDKKIVYFLMSALKKNGLAFICRGHKFGWAKDEFQQKEYSLIQINNVVGKMKSVVMQSDVNAKRLGYNNKHFLLEIQFK